MLTMRDLVLCLLIASSLACDKQPPPPADAAPADAGIESGATGLDAGSSQDTAQGVDGGIDWSLHEVSSSPGF